MDLVGHKYCSKRVLKNNENTEAGLRSALYWQEQTVLIWVEMLHLWQKCLPLVCLFDEPRDFRATLVNNGHW